MTTKEYQEEVLKLKSNVCIRFEHQSTDIVHAMLGINSESGELADAVKKWLIYNKPLDYPNILEECGDLLWYISLLLSSTGFTIDQAMQSNINKLHKRYPNKTFNSHHASIRLDKQNDN